MVVVFIAFSKLLYEIIVNGLIDAIQLTLTLAVGLVAVVSGARKLLSGSSDPWRGNAPGHFNRWCI